MTLAASLLCLCVACEPDVKPDDSINGQKPGTGTGNNGGSTDSGDPYADLSAYKTLKSYVDREAYPSFILGVAVPINSTALDKN